MKNSAVRLIAALVTFTVGVALVTLWLGHQHTGHTRRAKTPCHRRAQAETPPPAAPRADFAADEGLLPVLAYCELVDNPERYDGKFVRVRASLRMSIHGLFLSDVTCGSYENNAAVDFHEPQREELMEMFFGPDSPTRVRPGPAELIAVGRFEKVVPSRVSDSLLDTAPLRFEMIRVEEMHVEKAPVVEPQARKVAR